MRRTLLFLPGNNPGNLQSGAVFGADGIILDLEDSVSPAEKDAARLLVASALMSVDYAGVERAVRINTLAAGGEADIAAVVPWCLRRTARNGGGGLRRNEEDSHHAAH